MEHNLPLYVECVNAKSDVSKADDANILNRMLTQILKTYRFILNRYFRQIEMLFEPFYVPNSFMAGKEQKIAIVGCLSENQCC